MCKPLAGSLPLDHSGEYPVWQNVSCWPSVACYQVTAGLKDIDNGTAVPKSCLPFREWESVCYLRPEAGNVYAGDARNVSRILSITWGIDIRGASPDVMSANLVQRPCALFSGRVGFRG